MSSVVINFPDCAELGTSDKTVGNGDEPDTITITTEGCPAPLPGPPPILGTGEIIAIVLVSLALIAGVVIVRYQAHENKPAKLQARNEARKVELEAQNQRRKIELDGQVRKIEASRRQTCGTCGDVYDPALEAEK